MPGAAVTVLRLNAPLSVLEQRIRLRDADGPDAEIEGARWWAEDLAKAGLEDVLVETADGAVAEIVYEVLRIAGWLS